MRFDSVASIIMVFLYEWFHLEASKDASLL